MYDTRKAKTNRALPKIAFCGLRAGRHAWPLAFLPSSDKYPKILKILYGSNVISLAARPHGAHTSSKPAVAAMTLDDIPEGQTLVITS
jgi:hypothetical protein